VSHIDPMCDTHTTDLSSRRNAERLRRRWKVVGSGRTVASPPAGTLPVVPGPGRERSGFGPPGLVRPGPSLLCSGGRLTCLSGKRAWPRPRPSGSLV